VNNFCHLIEGALLLELATNSESLQLFCKPYVKSRSRPLCPDLNVEILERNLAGEAQCLREISLPENSVLGRIFQLQRLDESGIEIAYDYYECV
jgi:hypothetical protein